MYRNVQVQTMKYEYDFHEYHGRIPLTWLWTQQPAGGDRPPQWARDLQLRSYYLISTAVMGTCYWAGWLMLGMEGRYPEYTVSGE
ncbi:hypothetical protein LTR86_002828 [Recurvomyces mirabilis]|nr:hypothetical protein LTR86_002828 [Recurvomyces mirabilis]